MFEVLRLSVKSSKSSPAFEAGGGPSAWLSPRPHLQSNRLANAGLRAPLCVWMLAALVGGCSPEFNWRSVQGPDEPLRALFPCKPQRFVRALPAPVAASASAPAPSVISVVPLASSAKPPSHATGPVPSSGAAGAQLILQHCVAGGITYALTTMLSADPSGSAEPQMAMLMASALQQLPQAQVQRRPWARAGAGPDAQAWTFQAARDGRPLQGRAVFFTRGARAYQAMVLGASLPPDVVDPFFEGLELAP